MAKKMKNAALMGAADWYKDAVIYQVHVKSYFDANNDGVGDFKGLIEKLDYIAELGVTAIWLLPFYPSPMRDDGYDIADYRAIEPSYGSMGEVRQFIQEAHKRGLRIITELVINHTSDQHPWFQKARHSKKDSKARNFYVWSDTNQKYEGTRIIFSDTENSNWTWDPIAEQYFWHRFYSNQPDLNFDNPDVLKEVLSIMRFWFDMGVDGLRLDAIPYLVEREGTTNENLPETHAVLKSIRAELDANYPDRMLLAEANLWPEDIQQYFGNGDECHMAFHFPLMPRMYMAIAQEDRFPIIDILRQMPEIPETCQWAIFLRNHDELTLEMVTDQERDYLWNHYAYDKRARLNLGIRRRLAPLVERDRRRIELLKSLLLSMPGTPTIYYGDEIGMGDNIFLGDRHGVRTPMQWTNDRNGGFSRADPASLTLPTIMDPLYGFQAINVEAQARDAHSLLNWTRRMLSIRKQQKAFGRGSLKILSPANRRILAYLREYNSVDTSETILCVANMSRAAQAGELDLTAYAGKIPIEMIGGTLFPPVTKLNYLLTLPPYGFYWFLLVDEAQMPSWYVAPAADVLPELPTLIIKQGLQDILQLPARDVLEKECLPGYLLNRNWFFCWPPSACQYQLQQAELFGEPEDLFLFSILQQSGCSEKDERYHLALGFIADHQAGTFAQQLTIARLRKKRTAGLLTDAFSIPDFNRRLITYFSERTTKSYETCDIQFTVNPELPVLDEKQVDDIHIVNQHKTFLVIVGEKLSIKPVRTLIYGAHPFIELSRLLHARNFTNVVRVVGEARRLDQQGASTLIMLQEHIVNQGDAWQWIQNILERAFRDRVNAGSSRMNDQVPPLAELENFARTLGKRLGEMHLVLSQPANEAISGVSFMSRTDSSVWIDRILQQLDQVVNLLSSHPQAEISSVANRLALEIDAISGYMKKRAEHLLEAALQSRIHGNLHLGQVLVARGDVYFGCFDECPSSILLASRLPASPLKDVADLLCSFDDVSAMTIRNISATDTVAESEQVRALCMYYRHQAKASFYDSYCEVIAASTLEPEPPERTQMILKLAFIENRINEVLRSCSNTSLLLMHLIELDNRLNALLEEKTL
ncbi:MAG TPA: maltose alpha-D-glucosyltransferase [Cellvibrio sp.]|nr:maltose alpha-D-glucosyltransferase [Cellvibrio sp.]